jgi:hypothetical protein
MVVMGDTSLEFDNDGVGVGQGNSVCRSVDAELLQLFQSVLFTGAIAGEKKMLGKPFIDPELAHGEHLFLFYRKPGSY